MSRDDGGMPTYQKPVRSDRSLTAAASIFTKTSYFLKFPVLAVMSSTYRAVKSPRHRAPSSFFSACADDAMRSRGRRQGMDDGVERASTRAV